MSELEHALRDALTDPPVSVSTTGNPLHDIEDRLYKRRQRRRRTGIAALAASAVAAIAVPIAVVGLPTGGESMNSKTASGARANSNQGGATAAVPAAVRAAAERLAKEPGSHASRQVQWVRTTVGRF